MLNPLGRVAVLFVGLHMTSLVMGLNILLTNDDGWFVANIRATYNALKAAGHNVLLVAPAVQNSGQGGRFVLPTVNITSPGAGNAGIWYFNGTPAATAIFGLDVIAPMYFGHESVDLVVVGPHEGFNAGTFFYTFSGTLGAAYTAIYRGIPAVAFSAGNNTHRNFNLNTGQPDDPANVAARLATTFVDALANTTTPGERVLPLGVGIGVNFPVTVFSPGSSCTDPPFVFTHLTGGATARSVLIRPNGFPESVSMVAPGVNVNYNGIPNLQGETVISSECSSSVSIFSVDYDAPVQVALPLQLGLAPLLGNGL